MWSSGVTYSAVLFQIRYTRLRTTIACLTFAFDATESDDGDLFAAASDDGASLLAAASDDGDLFSRPQC